MEKESRSSINMPRIDILVGESPAGLVPNGAKKRCILAGNCMRLSCPLVSFVILWDEN